MRVTHQAGGLYDAVNTRIAKVTIDIEVGEQRYKELEADAEQSESIKKARATIRIGIDRAKKIRDSLTVIHRTLDGLSPDAEAELNDNECALLSYVSLK